MKNFHVVNYHVTNRCNDHCTCQTLGNLTVIPLFEILKEVPLDSEKFSSRYTKEGLR